MKKPYQIRIDEELLKQIQESAKNNDRSVNAEIRHAIKKYLRIKIR